MSRSMIIGLDSVAQTEGLLMAAEMQGDCQRNGRSRGCRRRLGTPDVAPMAGRLDGESARDQVSTQVNFYKKEIGL